MERLILTIKMDSKFELCIESNYIIWKHMLKSEYNISWNIYFKWYVYLFIKLNFSMSKFKVIFTESVYVWQSDGLSIYDENFITWFSLFSPVVRLVVSTYRPIKNQPNDFE